MLMINPDRRPTIDQIMTRPMIRDSKTLSPPMSTQKRPFTVSPGIVSTMTVLGYKSEEIIDSLRDQNYNQVMATYLILQHQSPGGDCGHQQEKTMQTGHVLNLAYLQAFPVPLKRATEPATPNFTLPSKPQEKEEKKYTRKGSIRHSMPDTLFRKSEKTYYSNLVYQKRRRALLLTCSSEEMSENFSDSKIRSSDSLMSSVQTSLLMYTASSRLDHSETTHDTDNISSLSYQEEIWSSMETAQSVTPRGSFSGDVFQEEDMAHEMTMTLEETRTKEVTMADGMTQTESITEEETVIKHEDIILEATITREETMAQLATLTQEDSITQEEAISHGQPEDAGSASSGNRRHFSWKRVFLLRSSEEVQPQLHGL
ncbi:Sperm motility kinase 3 [Cricetulus griseus]|uniref:non-specific serine/threonine protein kinase n=1 Tax=Cricetulus griseus TaxID=10029 RepID=G3IPC8_CRIGR|nr:Sperm motility kinase 3 [Cricetulus griseus]